MEKPKLSRERKHLIARSAKAHMDEGMKAKEGRMSEVLENELSYNNKTKREVLKGRHNIPIPVMSGFVDTLMSKMDDVPAIEYAPGKESALKLARMTSAAWRRDSSATAGKWGRKDRATKKLAIFSGRGINRYYAESDPKYRSVFEVVDHVDFYCDARYGLDLDGNPYKGQCNIPRTMDELEKGAESGRYDKRQVMKLRVTGSEKAFSEAANVRLHKQARLQSMGVDEDDMPESATHKGELLFSEHVELFEGDWYVVFFEQTTGTWIRCVYIEEDYESGLCPWTTWATHEDAFNFWSKAPADDIRPVAEAIHVSVNQALDNRGQRNRPQRAYDVNMFDDPESLEYEPDGMVPVDRKVNEAISSGVYTFETPEVDGTIELVNFLDGYVGQKTGITPGAQGAADKDVKASVYFGDMQQVADRFGLYNKSYSDMYAELGQRHLWGLKEHMPEKTMLSYIGPAGIEWDELLRRDLMTAGDEDLIVVVKGANAEAQADGLKKKMRSEALDRISKDGDLKKQVSPRWMVESLLRLGEYDENEIRVALDTKNEGGQEILSEAAAAIEEILAGKRPKLNRGATTGYVQKIVDFATDTELDDTMYKRLMAFAKAHIPYVRERAARELWKAQLAPPQPEGMESLPEAGAEEVPDEAALPGARMLIPQGANPAASIL